MNVKTTKANKYLIAFQTKIFLFKMRNSVRKVNFEFFYIFLNLTRTSLIDNSFIHTESHVK